MQGSYSIEGIEIARKEQPDTILLDIIMPHLDGYDVCKKLKEDELTSHIPVVMITAIKTDSESRVKGLNMGADAFLSKPIDASELCAVVNVMLRIKKAEDILRADKEALDNKVIERTKELIESEEKYRYLVERANDGICIIQDGLVVFTNPRLTEMWGGIEEDILATPFSNYVHPDELKKLVGYYNKRLKGEYAPSIYETVLLHNSGNSVFVEISAGVITYKGEAADLILVRDISERKQAEDLLKSSEEKLKIIFESAPDAIYLSDLKGTFIDGNKAAEKLLGYKKEDLIGKNFLKLNILSVKDLPKAARLLGTNLQSKGSGPDEFDLKRKDGSRISAEISTFPVKIKNKKVVLGIARDITERKRSEQVQKVLYNISNAVIRTDNLKSLISVIEKELGTVIDTTNFYIALYDNETDTFSLPFLADEKESIVSFPATKTFTNYVLKTEKSLLADKRKVKQMISSGDFEMHGPASEIWLGVPLKTDEKIIGVLAVQSYTDKNAFSESDMIMLEFVSEQIGISIGRKKDEEDLIKALNKAEESDRLKTIFLSTMSHELRTPLNAVIGFSSMIDENSLMKEVLDFNKAINQSGLQLLHIIENIFDISNIEAGITQLKIKDFELKELTDYLYRTVKSEQSTLGKEQLEIVFKSPDNLRNIKLNSDKTKIQQIIINLLVNALKFTEQGFIEFGYHVENESDIKFFIKDTGIGILADKKNIVFDKFMQVEDGFTREYGGVGLGLSISKRLVELLNGKIWFESELGVGSTFYITFPDIIVKHEIAEAIPTDTKQNFDFSANCILIVEDSTVNYLYVYHLIKRTGTKILWAKNGREAIDMFVEHTDIDLVLMDLRIPVIDGFETSKEMKRVRPEIRIIVLSAYAGTVEKDKAMDLGCDDFFSKPFNANELLDRINQILN